MHACMQSTVQSRRAFCLYNSADWFFMHLNEKHLNIHQFAISQVHKSVPQQRVRNLPALLSTPYNINEYIYKYIYIYIYAYIYLSLCEEYADGRLALSPPALNEFHSNSKWINRWAGQAPSPPLLFYILLFCRSIFRLIPVTILYYYCWLYKR